MTSLLKKNQNYHLNYQVMMIIVWIQGKQPTKHIQHYLH